MSPEWKVEQMISGQWYGIKYDLDEQEARREAARLARFGSAIYRPSKVYKRRALKNPRHVKRQAGRSVLRTILESAAKAGLTYSIGLMLRGGPGGIPVSGISALLKK